MNQKICNKILVVLNVLIFTIFFIFGLWGTTFKFGLEYDFSAMSFVDEYQNIMSFFNVIFIVIMLLNVCFLIQNKKNKKILFWYLIPIIYYLIASLTLFKISLPNYLENSLWSIIPSIFFIINLVKEFRNRKKKKVLIWHSSGLALCIIMFFINAYNSIIWLIISSIILFINSSNLDNNSKTMKKINTGIIVFSIILLIIAIIRCLVLVSNMQKVDDETVDFISQIKASLIDENKKNILIPVCKNNKWGYINPEGKEIIPCEYDMVSQEAFNTNGILKYDFYYLKRNNEYTLITSSGKSITTRLNSPAPWITGSMLDHYNSEKDNISLLLSSARETIRECFNTNSQYINPSSSKHVEYDNIQYTDSSNSIYVFNMENNYILELEKLNSLDSNNNEKYLIRLKKDGRVIESYNNISIGNIQNIESYTNGDIPFYNLENGIHGYYSVKNNKFVTIKGQYEILDVVDDNNVIIRDWRIPTDTRDIVLYQEKRTILKALSIVCRGNGYIIKKENNKMVYANKDANEITAEYDVILDNYVKYGILICANINDNKKEYVLSDLEGNILTNSPYDIMYVNIEYNDIKNLDLVNSNLHSIYNKYYTNFDASKASNNENPTEMETSKKTFNKNSPLFKITTENYGDYIDLGKDVIGSSSTSDDWRILYNDTENGKLYAILANYLPTNNKVFKEAGLRANYSVYSTVSRDELIKGLESEKWNQLISENLSNNVKVQGAVSADILMNSYNEKHKTNFYYTSGKTYLYNEPNNEASGLDTLYVLTGVEDESNELNNAYLLNSPVQNYNNLLRIVNEKGQFATESYRDGSGVRPVAVISYDAQIVSNSLDGKTYFKVIQ